MDCVLGGAQWRRAVGAHWSLGIICGPRDFRQYALTK